MDFIVRRGGTIQDLLPLTLARLRQYNEEDWVILKLAAGINNLTKLVNTGHRGKRVLVRSSVSADDILSLLLNFKEEVINIRPTTVVSFVTVPTASFAKFQEFRHLASPFLSEEAILSNQTDLDAVLDTVNIRIAEANAVQHGVIPRTLSWHASIRRKSKRRNKSGRLRADLRTRLGQLYDGLHAVSTLKHRWFQETYKAFSIEREALKRHLSH